MNRSFLLSLFFTTLAVICSGQVTGLVTDVNGEPLIGATVLLKGTDQGTITEVDGTYSLDAKDGVLVFSFTGFEAQEIPIEGKKKIDVVLQTANLNLNEIVVIGYGTQRKADITTAVVVVDEESIKNRPMVSAAEALQGKAAGVQVVQPSGKPGGDISVRVRGSTSVTAGNEPLYVVDGVPTTDIRGLNPADIASMTVLKDASSAAIYGARAANGVVIITTKRGKEGASTVTFNAYYGVSNLRRTVETLGTRDYRDLINEIIPGAYDPAWTNYTNWSDETFGVGQVQSYQLAFAGGNEKTRYLFSTNYLNQQGIVAPASFDRYSMRLNLDNQVNKWLKMGTNLNLLRSSTEDTPDNASSGRGGVIMSALNTPPFLRTYKADGSGQYDPNPFQPSWENPIAYMFGADQRSIDTRIFGNANLEATVFKGFSLKTNLGVDLNASQWDYYLDPFRTNFGRDQRGIGRASKSNSNIWLWENTANYQPTIGESRFGILVGSSLQQSTWSNSFISGFDFPTDTLVKTLNAANVVQGSTDVQEWALASFFGRISYDYKSRYLLTATLRRDGSSKLANPWGTMPSFSVGWRISEEPFMERFAGIYDMKIRVGWGKNGNQEGISNYAKYGLVSYFRRTPTNPLSGPASVQVSYGNPDLKWETTTQSNIGVDLALYRGRINFTADAYYKKTEDLILNVQLPSSLDINTIQTNAGTVENKGLEFGLSTVNTEGRALNWTTDLNISFNRNKVLDLQYTDVYFFGPIYSNNQDVAIVREGLPLGVFYGYVSDGVDPETGDLIFRDVNKNGIWDTGDRTVIGDANPDFTYGITNNLSWKNFDLSIFLQGSQGNDIYNATRIDLEGMFDSKNQSTTVLNRWTPENRDTDIPRARNLYNINNSSRFVEDGSYIRLKAVTLSYNVNPKSLERLKVQKMSVYVTGQNLLTFTNYSGFDPEVNAFGRSAVEQGIDYGTYPQARTLTAGVNVEF
ncbi:MAG: TonB-dependent receptor [Saprospiraceae bacterium]|nr:TonB-dependent receptor [Saprospiraceae bacterium]